MQVSNAYAALKNLSPEELDALPHDENNNNHENLKAQINFMLDHCERELKISQDTKSKNLKAVIFRLNSKNPAVRQLALRHSGNCANDQEFLKALAKILKAGNIDSTTSRLIGALEFNSASKKFLASELVMNPEKLTLDLILNLSGQDYDIAQKLLINALPEAVAPILRRWPANKIPDAEIFGTLLKSDDPLILVPVLSLMKLHFQKFMFRHQKRLDELSLHPSPAVRAWLK